MAATVPQVKPATTTINQQKPNSRLAPKHDVTILSQPSHAARQGISQIFDVMLSGTPFMRQLLLQEADVIYECKACRSLFRGLINFVDHKKNFCTLRVGAENVATAQSATTGLQRWACQDKEPIPIIIPESPDEENDPKVGNVKKKISSSPSTPKQHMVIRKPDTTYVLVRPIPGTTKAMEQMLIKPDQIIHQSHLDMLSNFKTSRQESDGTAKLVGEITIKQAQKVATSTSPKLDEDDTCNEKRKTLHDLLSKVKVSSSHVNLVSSGSPPTSPVKSKSSSKQLLMVTLGSQKKVAVSKQVQNSANKKKAVCKTCKKECINFTALAWHERMHKKPKLKCSICGSEVQSLYNLKRHLLTVHHLTRTKVETMMKIREQKFKLQVKDIGKQQDKDTGKQQENEKEESSEEESESESSSSEEDEGGDTPTCPVCQKTFASKRNVNRHLKIHQREGHLTSTNNKKLSSEQIAKKRVQAIIDEKNLKCRKCSKILSGLRRLQQHCCNHFKLNRYRCSSCPYENSDYTQMRRHVMGKHGRQFRSINQISDAIRQMKVGLWVNLRKSDSGEEDISQPSKKFKKSTEARRNYEETIKKVDATTKKSEISHREFASKKSHSKSDLDKKGENDKSETKISMPTIVFDRASRSRDSSIDRSMDSSSIPSTPPKLTPIKKDIQDNKLVAKTSDITLRNSSSRSSSPASARMKIELESPKRDTPIRQARLNHRNISSNIAQNLKLENDDGNDKLEKLEMLMDRRMIRCIDCNKKFNHVSSLRRHIHNFHLQVQETLSGNRSARNNRADENEKVQSIDDFINVSQLKCTKCHKRFDTMSSLKHHVARHLGYSTYKCRYCKYISRNYTWFKKHLQLSHPNVVKNVSAFGNLMSSMRVLMK